MGGPDAGVRSMRYTSDVDAEAGSPTGSVADAAPIFLFRDGLERANPRRNRRSAWRTGSLLSESSALPRLAEQPAPGSPWRSSQRSRTHPVPRGWKSQINVMHPRATSHASVTAARLSSTCWPFRSLARGRAVGNAGGRFLDGWRLERCRGIAHNKTAPGVLHFIPPRAGCSPLDPGLFHDPSKDDQRKGSHHDT